ncbi:sorbosone dehydrogenase family protein [Nibrella saemangeumensis]|uniref:Sorbosone dehydrogenase family protein n=1 Tax=Nibrella saemangeumensis TaxID=1084526 RepID=A0ABP8NF08_9BACT
MSVFFRWTLLPVILGVVAGCNRAVNVGQQRLIPETEEQPTAAAITGHVFKPALIQATEERIRQLRVPAGFQITKFASDVGKPRMIAVSATGHVYVTDRENGKVLVLRDTNGDGKADEQKTLATVKDAHGLAIHNGKLYLVTVNDLYSAPMNQDGTLGTMQKLLDDLPDAGQHPNRTLAFGPDGKLYITVGSTCNACAEPNPEHATILVANPDGSNRKVFARGLRNTIGFGWHPETKALYGLDHGIDWLGDDEQREEVNQIVEGAHYGWPYIYGDGKYNPADRPKGDTTYQQFLQKTKLPLLTYEAHSAPLGMVFYTGNNFPAAYRHDAFVAMRGSWNRSKPSGYKVVRLRFENGRPAGFEDFVTGFLVDNNQGQFGRPVGIAVYTDGSLLFSDDNNGVIYRVAYVR